MKRTFLFFYFISIFLTAFAQKDTIYTINHNAQFVTGNRGFSEFWSRNFKPSFKDLMKKNEGEGKLRFTILKDGRVTNVMVIKTLSESLDAAAIEAMKKTPNWLPAMQYGVPVDSDQEMSFWLGDNTKTNPNFIDLAEAEKYVNDGGFAFELYIGGGTQLGSFNTFFKPTHFVLGLGVLYNIRRWTMGFHYDFGNNLKPKKPFTLGTLDVTSEHRFAPFNVYFPIKYRIDLNKDWFMQPYFTPTLNNPTINIAQDKKLTPILNLNTFSPSFGVQFNKIVVRQATITHKQKARIMNSMLTFRVNVNPIQFKSPYSSLNGTALNFTIGVLGDSRSGKYTTR